MSNMVPKIGTILEIASATLINTICHPPIASVHTQIKNIAALQINVK